MANFQSKLRTVLPQDMTSVGMPKDSAIA
eukprot:COSAG04_NODE_8040_length_1030_cov_4.723953_1_plen_28_part_10